MFSIVADGLLSKLSRYIGDAIYGNSEFPSAADIPQPCGDERENPDESLYERVHRRVSDGFTTLLQLTTGGAGEEGGATRPVPRVIGRKFGNQPWVRGESVSKPARDATEKFRKAIEISTNFAVFGSKLKTLFVFLVILNAKNYDDVRIFFKFGKELTSIRAAYVELQDHSVGTGTKTSFYN